MEFKHDEKAVSQVPEPEKRELDFSNYPLINKAIETAFNNYYKYHVRAGGFVSACLRGDIRAYLLADEENSKPETFRQIVQFLHNELPEYCHGSIEKCQEHLKKRRFE